MKHSILLPIGVAATLALAGCSTATGAGVSSPTNAGTPTRGSAAGGGSAGGRLGGFPGVSGLVADVTGSTAQVQTPTSQTAVTWTRTTRFSEQRSSKPAALKVGDCVIAVSQSAVPGGSGGSGGATPAPTTPPSASGQTTKVAATSVEIFSATSTGCGFGPRAGGNGARRSDGGGTATSRPSGIPTSRPSFTGGPRNGARFGASGTVTAIESSSFTIASTRGSAKGTSQTVTVTWSGTTRFTALASTSASAVKVGVCLSATGKTGDTGALTATTIALSPPVNGSCAQSGRSQRGGSGPTATGATLNG